jgi:hypothetical protein
MRLHGSSDGSAIASVNSTASNLADGIGRSPEEKIRSHVDQNETAAQNGCKPLANAQSEWMQPLAGTIRKAATNIGRRQRRYLQKTVHHPPLPFHFGNVVTYDNVLKI